MIMNKDLFEVLLYPNPHRPNIHNDDGRAVEVDEEYWGELQSDYWIDLRKSEQHYQYT